MLKNDFYQILDETASETRVRLNPAHVIYQAHFPGRPITPGACQIQMVTEILAGRLGAEVSLTAIKARGSPGTDGPFPEVERRGGDVPGPGRFRVWRAGFL